MTDIVEALRVNNITIALPDGSVKFVRHVAADEIERLREALWEAADAIEFWGSYANEYFKDKHDFEGDVAKVRAALGERESDEGYL